MFCSMRLNKKANKFNIKKYTINIINRKAKAL